MYELDLYETENGRIPINEYLKELRDENQLAALTKIKAYTEMLTEHGFQINDYRPNAIKKINKENNIWELRPGDSRVFFFHYTGKKLVLLHAFTKKSQKTPHQQIDQAVREMKDYRRRHEDG